MTNKKTMSLAMVLLAGVLLLVAFWLYVGDLYGNSFLFKRPDHGACFTIEADVTNAQGKNRIPELKEAMRKRFHFFGTRVYWEPLSETRFQVYAPISDPKSVQEAKDMVFRRGVLEFRLVHVDSWAMAAKGQTAEGYEVLHSATEASDKKDQERLFLVSKTVEGGPSGISIRKAFPISDSGKSDQTIAVNFTPEGGIAFAALTRNNVGRRVAIVMDGEVLAAPVIRDEIKGGNASISGNFSRDQLFRILMLMQFPLPIPVELAEVRTF